MTCGRLRAPAILAALALAACSNGKTPLVIYSPHGRELLSNFERRFEADPVERQDARGAVLHDGSFDGEVAAAIEQSDLERVGETALAAAGGFFDEQTPFCGRLRGIHEIHLFIEHTIQQTT